MNTQPLVIFGSAARRALHFFNPNPRDIDVAVLRPLSIDDSKRIDRWAADHDLGKLHTDVHTLIKCTLTSERASLVDPNVAFAEVQDVEPGTPGARVVAKLPAPCGVRGSYYVLPGSGAVEVQWVDYYSIPALIRAYGHDAALLASQWKHLRDDPPGTLYGALMLDVSGYEDGMPKEDWTGYVTGVRSLRNAIAKAPEAWKALVANVEEFPECAIIDAIAERPGRGKLREHAAERSSGGRARLIFTKGGLTTQYGDEVIAYGKVRQMFFDGMG